MKSFKVHSLTSILKAQIFILALLLLTFCAEHKKKERVPIDEKDKKQERKREKLTLHEADASGKEADLFTLQEEKEKTSTNPDSKELTKVAQNFEKNTVVELKESNSSEDHTKPVINVDFIVDNAVMVQMDSTNRTAQSDIKNENNTVSKEESIKRTLKSPNTQLQDSTNNISVHLTDIDLDKENTKEAEKKKMFVQLETRVLFEGGAYELSNKYKERLNDLIRGIEDEISTYRQNNADEELVLLIQVKGYADKKPFYEGQNPEERQKLNQELSSKRATAVMEYIKKGVNHKNVAIEEVTSGLGEELPLGVYDSEDLEDQNRRSCSIYLLICSQK